MSVRVTKISLLMILVAALSASCTIRSLHDSRPTTGGEGVLGYIIRNASNIRLQRNGNSIRVYAGSGTIDAPEGFSPDSAYVAVYDVPVGDLQTIMNSSTDTATLSADSNLVMQVNAQADGGFDSSANVALENSFLLVVVSDAPPSSSIRLARAEEINPTAAWGLNTVADGFIPMFREPIGDRSWQTANSIGNASGTDGVVSGFDGAGNVLVLGVTRSASSTDLISWRYAYGSWQNLGPVDSVPTNVEFGKITLAVAESGAAVVCYESDTGMSTHAMAAYYDIAMEQWSAPASFEPLADSDAVHCAIDSEGNASAVYRTEIPLGGGVKIVQRGWDVGATQWTDGYIVNTGAALVDNMSPRIAFWQNGNSLVAWRGSDRVSIRRKMNGAWELPTEGPPIASASGFVRLGTLSSDEAILVEGHVNAQGEGLDMYGTLISATGSLGVPVALGRYNTQAVLAVSPEGYAVIAFDSTETVGSPSNGSLKFNKWTRASSWDNQPTLLAGGSTTYGVELGGAAIDRNGNIFISYTDRDGALEPPAGRVSLYSRDSQAWSTVIVSGSTIPTNRGVSLSLAPQTVNPIYRGLATWYEAGQFWARFFE